jgi:hypothetical protein
MAKVRGWFLNFQEAPLISYENKHISSVNIKLGWYKVNLYLLYQKKYVYVNGRSPETLKIPINIREFRPRLSTQGHSS